MTAGHHITKLHKNSDNNNNNNNYSICDDEVSEYTQPKKRHERSISSVIPEEWVESF